MPRTGKESQDVRLNNVGLLIFQAASSGELETLESVFSTVPQNEVQKSINYTDKSGMTPLIAAVKTGNLNCVKLLLYHGADISHPVKQTLYTQRAWNFAKKAGHVHIEQYLRKCHNDFATLNTTRAQLELTVYKIAKNPYCSLAERERFDVCLSQLIKSCNFVFDDDNENGECLQPLILEAARSNNIPIVLKLIQKYNINVMTHDTETAETLMHIACQIKSKLRYYLVRHYPGLMRKRDTQGILPLHIACKNNDIEFISWLFGNILAAVDNNLELNYTEPPVIKRTKSHSDIHSSAASIPPNRSISIFPVSPVDLTSPKVTSSYFFVGDSRNNDECDGDESDSIMNMREISLTRSHESVRSFTVSVSGSSRSGSSERTFPKTTKSGRKTLQSSSSSDEAVDFGHCDGDSGSSIEPTQHSVLCNGASEEVFLSTKPSMPLLESEVNALLDLENIVTPHPLTRTDILDMKPFSIAVDGDSIFHILAREGYSDLLNIIVKVADFLKHQVDLSVLTHREGFSSRLPIEEAIYIKSPECVRMLISLSMEAGLMPMLLQDPHILRGAVFMDNIQLVKILIESGFHKGLKPAISLAIISGFDNVLRVLLYWQTQVVNSMEFSKMKTIYGRRERGLDRGTIKWEEIQLESIHPCWLNDSYHAVESVSKNLKFSHIRSDITEHDFDYFKQLGKDCLYYFDNLVLYHRPNEVGIPLFPITEVNISENQLSSVPPEIFQMQSLSVLRLSHNGLQKLPSSENLYDNIYTSSLRKLELDWNNLTELPEDLFRGVAHSLKELSAQYNQLDSLPPGLWVMPNLKRIKLAHNKLDRLHCFSNPCYFNDHELSKVISTSFTTNDLGELICTSGNSNSHEMKQNMKYLKRLAMFYHTVCTARCPDGPGNISLIYPEMISIHLMRYLDFSRSTDQWVNIPESTRILKMFEDEEFESVTRCTMDLELLDLSYNSFKEFPWDLACISPKLQKLDLRMNKILQMDIIHSSPQHLMSLILIHNQVTTLKNERSYNLPCSNPMRLLCLQDEANGKYCQHCNHPTLESLSNLILDHNRLSYFPIIDDARSELSDISSDSAGFEVVYCDTYFPNLSILSLANNQFTAVPENLHRLLHLSSLTLSHNPINRLPLDMGLINSSNLLLLKLDGLFIRNIPETLLENHTPKQLLNYLKALKQKSRPYRRMKLMVVGAANMGKTSLLLSLVKKGRMKRFTEVERGVNNLPLATVGVELGDWEYSHGGKPKVTFMTWDFGGQEEYYATHQCFLTRRSLYLLLWNVMDGEDGLKSLRPWLENIESRAPKSPVIIIATHIDMLPPGKRNERIADLQAKFKEMYIFNSHRMYTYPSIHSQCQFVNVNSSRHIDALRDFIYDFAIQYKVQGPRDCNADIKPLLEEPIPESYVILQDFIRETAEVYIHKNKRPILTKKEYIQAIRDSEHSDRIKKADVEQATSFLHDSGIILHFKDSNLLNDLYFINPQWLCSMLAKLITVREYNPYQRQGFMLMDDAKKIYMDCFQEFIALMQNFEVVFVLDEKRLVIPSLLPMDEEESSLIFSRSISHTLTNSDSFDQVRCEPHAPMYEAPHPILTRYYLLPFIPNGFFTRLMARLMSSEIIDHLQLSLLNNKLGDDHVINSAHWKCWRNGVMITWNHVEIFHIVPLSSSLPGMDKVVVVTKKDCQESIEALKGIEIKVAILPEEYIGKCSTLDCQLSTSASFKETDTDIVNYSRGKCLATWLLHQGTTIVDSVFEDWYESFACKKGFDPHQENVRIANPCNICIEHSKEAEVMIARSSNYPTQPPSNAKEKVCYIFTSLYAALVTSTTGEGLVCPEHGTLKIADVAPDLVFCDFLPGTVFTDHSSLVIRERLGDGGFGTVFRATLHTGGTVRTVAAKQFTPDMLGFLEQDADIIEQLKAWDIYHKASIEARVMCQLSHDNILSLIGISFHPLSLLVELAPEGDLRTCVERFSRERVRLSRRTLQCTLIQVAEALNYLHSRQFIYRDLKPENILVWKFPRPETQWLPNAAIYVKVADYGISKQITPQGIRGMEGTRPYLPPEVILHGGREAYSKKLDVYAFGMFIYFLVSFKTPFECGRPITALLDEGKRPELTVKQRPHALQLFELMCWCWSERAVHRPDFSVILNILKSGIFMNLLAAFPLLDNKEVITASCMRTFYGQKFSGSVTHSHSTMLDQSLASLGVTSLIYGKSAAYGEESTTQVWYGTEFGKCGVVQFQNTGITHEIFDLPKPKQRNTYISSIKLISDCIWVSTVGYGLFVYNSNNHEIISNWGTNEKFQIYTFMEVEETKRVLVLTHRGMFVFSSNATDITKNESLVPIYEYPQENKEMNIGIVITKNWNIRETEVWISSQIGDFLSILNPRDFVVKEKVPFIQHRDENGRKLRHMVTVEVNCRLVLAVANKHHIHMFDVEEKRSLSEEFNCLDICSHLYQAVRNCRVTSMSAKEHFLYAAIGGGAILCLNCRTMEVVHILDAYFKPARSLLMVNFTRTQSKPFDRLFSQSDMTRERSTSSQEHTLPFDSCRRVSLASTKSTFSTDSFSSEERPSNSLLISFGGGYKGVIGSTPDPPEDFILPNEGNKTNTIPAIPDESIGYLLLWSTEVGGRDLDSSRVLDSDVPKFDENEELAYDDDIVTCC